MINRTLDTFDWDAARKLARNDPEAFEQCRRDAIDALIDRAPARNRQHLRCLQWRIDRVRERAANPMAACLAMSEMMWDSFAGERGLVAALKHASRLAAGDEQSDLPTAKVLAFTPTRARRRGDR